MSFGKTTLRRWLPASALALALLCPLPVFAAQAGAEVPVTVRTAWQIRLVMGGTTAEMITPSKVSIFTL